LYEAAEYLVAEREAIMRMLISGDGVAGLTLANFLHRYGFEPVVIEQAAGVRRYRAGASLEEQGLTAR
jgi:2-polyprenyl-6-methoxyphenol hydroxylase-like FAD-dependent oxidoreductase